MELDARYLWVVPDPGIRAASDRDALADIQLSVGSRILTLNRSLEAQSELEEPRKTVCVSLFPFAEFVAANWWALLHEPAQKVCNDTLSYSKRHQIYRHRDGFAYPRVEFYGADSRVQIVANASQIDSAAIQFPTEIGAHENCTLDRLSTENTLLGLIDAVLARLTDDDDRMPLEESVDAVKRSRADPEEAEYCILAGLLGSDPYEPGDRLESTIRAVEGLTGGPLSREVFAISELETAVGRAQSILQLAHQMKLRSRNAARQAGAIKDEVRKAAGESEVEHAARPCAQGYLAAHRVRDLLSLGRTRPLPCSASKALLDSPAAQPDSSFNWHGIGTQGVGIIDDKGLGVAIDPHSHAGFQLAASFADFLFSAGESVFLSTSASTDRQKRNRAFAAEFLIPIEAIRAQLGQLAIITAKDIEELSREFGVSPGIVENQLTNQARDLLARGLEDRP